MKGQGQDSIPDKFNKPYDFVATEERIYSLWEKSGFFDPDKLPDRNKKGQPFSMVLPPPNVTGNLHMGSALMLAIEDIMVRYARMTGRKTMWIPGTDHAAIATQSVIEKKIQKEEGKSRYDLGREELLRRIAEHVTVTHDTITRQMRRMGVSIDWSREAFTLDDKRNLAVRTAFNKMYNDGLIYRGYRVVNWDPKGQTTISDDEIEYETRPAKLYTFKYSKDIPITISTTRPETKLGDTAIAVHPEDERYKKYIGQEFKTIFAGEEINLKVIADISVDPAFGTGALGVTPAHSMIDWEIAERHSLPMKQVINEYAKMMVGSETIVGKKTTEARLAVVAWLTKEGLLEKEEDIEHNVSLAQRTGGVVEPLPKLQWFVAVNKEFEQNGKKTTLKKLMIEAVTSGAIKIIPDHFEKVYFNWISNLRDWCISRQIWYGHRLPVWYRSATGDRVGQKEVFVGMESPKGDGWKQDEDTLDTWFSSGLWTFSTLGWPDKKEFDLHRDFHPTTILETGSDILFFWVARMILMSTYLLGEVPFKTVYLHGLVRDAKGRKISKSLGNNVDPLDMIAKYGADAVRMSLIVGVGPGSDSKIGEDKIKAYKLFANKLWNITRFVMSSCEGEKLDPDFTEFSDHDQKLMSDFDALCKDLTTDMDNYRYYLAAEKLYHYAWHEFADIILEDSKKLFAGGVSATNVGSQTDSESEKINKSRKQLLLRILSSIIKLLHPFMPFLTEEIWQEMNTGNSILMVESWPKS
ncbi:MAG: valine--tRNA ligase [Candidatus Paceibacterota bacterium]|jgi:valyl-tRNA synthetase